MDKTFPTRVCCIVAMVLMASLLASWAPAHAADQPAAQVPELVAGNNAFALDLYTDLIKTRAKDNLVFSPYSVSLALAMTYGGAGGDTAREMERVLHFAMPADEIHRAFAALQARQKTVFAPKGYELNIANGLWGQKGFAFREPYFNLTREKYGAALEEIDFRANPEKARQRINAWVEQHTKKKITDLLRKGAIDEDTRLVLANAVYLKGAWTKQFSKNLTHKEFFQVDADTKTPILMMSQRGRFRYFGDTDVQAIDLPIGACGVSMWILLPRQVDGLARLEKSLTDQRLQKLRMQMNYESVTVELPKFKIESELNLTKSLGALGMASAFATDKADFSKMAARPGIVLKAVAHKAYLNVDETGLEAAAATAVVGKEGAPPPKLVFRADHPFFYVIRESSSGSILFMGRVHNPAGKDKIAVKPAAAVVERAVAAHGGKERLAKLRTAELAFDFKGSDFPLVAGKKLESFDVKVREVYNLPNQLKKSIEGKIRAAGMLKDEEIKLTWAIDGEKVWVREGAGKVEVMKGKPLAAEEQYRPLQIFEMLARYDAFTWTQAGDIPTDPEDKLIAMRATGPGVDAVLLFNKASGLLARTRVLRSLPGAPRPMVGEVVYFDYQDVGGAMLPMKKTFWMDGKKIAEIHVTHHRFLEKIDPSIFAPPAGQTANGREALEPYLTPNGQLKERLVLRDAGGFVGRGTGARWEIETDGAWKRVAREGNSFATTEGRLDAKQLTTLAKELARFDLLSLPREMRHDPKVVVADGFDVVVEFGRQRWTFLAVRGFPDLPTPGLDTPQARFAGIARAIQAPVIDRPAEKNK